MRKTLVTPKRYESSSEARSTYRHPSPRSIPMSHRPKIMRPPSHIDFRTAVKMSQQASACSGPLSLTPLPTYVPKVADERYSCSNNSDQDMAAYSSGVESNGMPTPALLTPPTPESVAYHEPLTMGDLDDTWTTCQAWSDDSLGSIGLGLENDMAGLLPADLWSTTEHTHNTHMAQPPWAHSALSVSLQSVASDLVPLCQGGPSVAMSDCSIEDYSGAAMFPDDWTAYSTMQWPVPDGLWTATRKW
ncbi:hypothetical protein ACEQ8H_006962 [Pleosporales sp. CAS-2024a]